MVKYRGNNISDVRLEFNWKEVTILKIGNGL